MSYCKPSLVRVGSYIYIPLNNFIGSTLSMACGVVWFCRVLLRLAFPYHTLFASEQFRTLPITLPLSGPFLFLIPLAFSGPFLILCLTSYKLSNYASYMYRIVDCLPKHGTVHARLAYMYHVYLILACPREKSRADYSSRCHSSRYSFAR